MVTLNSALLLSAMAPLVSGDWTEAASAALCRCLCAALPVDGVALTLTGPVTGRVVMAASDPTALWLEELQLTAGGGPCTDATSGGEQVVVADLASAAGRWPGFAVPVTAGIGSVVAIPLRVGQLIVGSMDCYRRDVHAFNDDELADIGEAGRLLILGLAALAVSDIDDEFVGDLGLHAELHQATGMVMAALQLSPPDALDRLRGMAFVQGRLVTEVSADVITGLLAATLE